MAAAAMDSGALKGLLNGSGQEMKLILEPIALLVICAIVASIASLSLDEILSNWRKANFAAKTAALSSSMLTEMDYAVNGMARTRFPPIQEIWNKSTFPETDTDRLIVRGLTLCDW